MPVKISDELVSLARREAKAADRSLTAQIEHWATLGRAVETALRHDEVRSLKGAAGDLSRAFPDADVRQAVYAALERAVAGADRAALARTLGRNRVVYQADPGDSGLVERLEPNGTRTRGRFEKRRFVPARAGRRAGR